jgi:WhiB family redox-sensing transcriptional regulator
MQTKRYGSNPSRDRTSQQQNHDQAGVAPGRFRWQRWAACRETPKAVFFPVGNSQSTRVEEERAKALCRSCLVRPCCLDFALEHNESYGVWGGLNPDERVNLPVPAASVPERHGAGGHGAA